MPKYVYDFAEGNKDLKDLLGGKGANLAEMTNLGLPVPPGFTITTEACRAYLATGAEPAELRRRGRRAPRRARAGDGQAARRRRRPAAGLGALRARKFSMPGMMETVLNIGLNDESVHGLAAAGRQRAVRLGLLPPADPDVRQDRAAASTASTSRTRSTRPRHAKGAERRPRPGRRRPAGAGRRRYKDDRPRARRPRLPAGPARAAGPRHPRGLRLVERRPRRSSTAARSASPPTSAPRSTSGDGVRQPRRRTPAPASRSPATRPPAQQGVYGDYLQNAQGEDVVAGIRNTLPLARPGAASTSRRTTSCWRSWPRSSSTTATCATSSSPSSAASCGCCRPGSASAPPAAAFRHRHPARRRGPHRPRRGAAPGHRRAARPADVPALRRATPTASSSPRA